MKQGAGFGVKVAGEHAFRFRGNGRSSSRTRPTRYHFPIVHKSFLNSLDGETEEMFDVLGQGGWVEDLGNGHSVMVMIPDLVDLEDRLRRPIPERFQALADELAKEHSPEVVRRVVRAVGGTGFNLNLFPNLACSMAFFRVLRPISVEETEIRHIAIGWMAARKPATARGCGSTSISRGRWALAAPTTRRAGSACSAVPRRATTSGSSSTGARSRCRAQRQRRERRDRDARRLPDVEEDDGGMTVHAGLAPASIDLSSAVAFAWEEADLLDARDYDAWLALWTEGGRYIIPDRSRRDRLRGRPQRRL
jgi:hypothetical protein